MDCFQDFCLYCDRESPDGAYCSQQCKLDDLSKASSSNPSSPTSPSRERSWNSSAYKLAPSYNYHQQSSPPSYDVPSSTHSSRPRSSYFMWNPSHQQSEQNERQLTPSSSRTSLSSTTSSSGMTASGGYSAQAQQQLHDYFSSFDQAKAAKRRSSLR